MNKTRCTIRSYSRESWIWNQAINGKHIRAAVLTRILLVSMNA